MTLDQLLAEGRQLWPDPMTYAMLLAVLGTVQGDVCRAVRDDEPSDLELELGNLIRTAVRALDDFGFDAIHALNRSLAAQRRFVERR